MKYAAVIGGLGLSKKRESRDEVFNENVGIGKIINFQPESVHYDVCYIDRGTVCE